LREINGWASGLLLIPTFGLLAYKSSGRNGMNMPPINAPVLQIGPWRGAFVRVSDRKEPIET
jgi:hypothetical protein